MPDGSPAELSPRPASPRDVAWIQELERRPENGRLLCAWPADVHARNLADPAKRYLVAEDAGGRPRGMVILAGLDSPARSVELVRIAVDAPGQGLGKPLLRRVVDLCFGELGANRLWLDVFEDNERARRVYRAVGFREEGISREAARRQDGSLGSLVVMAMLARERPPGR
jgi:diamine N-acetyltransferase